MSPNAYVRADQDIVHREVEDQVLILSMRTGQYFTIEGAGMVLWKRLASKATVPDLVQSMCDEYEVAPGAAAADVSRFLDELVAAGLVAPA